MKFKLSEIHPNPFRHLETYPIKPDKVAALVASIEQTGFWDNVVARPRPDGTPEIAYGHHRLDAAQKAPSLGPDAVIDLIIKDLDDETMIKVMANENMTEWGTSFLVDLDVIRAVVEAFGVGLIELDPPEPSAKVLRIAPGYTAAQVVGRRRGPSGSTPRWSYTTPLAYSETTVAKFLSWLDADGTAATKVHVALDALALIMDDKILDTEDFAGLGTTQAEIVANETTLRLTTYRLPTEPLDSARRAAGEVGRDAADMLRAGTPTKDVRGLASRRVGRHRNTRATVPRDNSSEFTKIARSLSHELSSMFIPESSYMLDLQELVDSRDEISPAALADLVLSLRSVAKECSAFAKKLERPSPSSTIAPVINATSRRLARK